MGTPFITLQEPTSLDNYVLGAPAESQPASVPRPFSDVMEVRDEVFVKEQKVPQENEFDADDPRSCHWVVYASVNKVVQEEVLDPAGNIAVPRRSSTRSTPVGTLRCVPFPHDPHPVPGGEYWNGELKGVKDDDGKEAGTKVATTGTTGTGTGTPSDRPTSLHDGKEPYLKLGRLAVTREFRGHGLAKLLVSTALAWLRAHPAYFNPSVAEVGLDGLGAASERDIPKWAGLVCVHAQEQVVGAWERLGFEIDEGMGRWMEEGMWHRGMFLRLDVGGG